MATTNLISQSLGDVLVESGNGSPDHSSPVGSYYSNKDTGSLFINSDGTGAGWDSMNKVSWGDIYIQDNTTNTSGSVSWVSLTGLTWTFYGGNGAAMVDNGKLTISTNRGGLYYVLGTASLQVQGVTASYIFYMGLSKNGDDPGGGFYSSASCDGNLSASAASEDDKTVVVTNYMQLDDGDTIEMAMKMSSAVPDGRLEAGTITIYRVSD